MNFVFLKKISVFMLTVLLTISTKAAADELQISPKFDACKSSIATAYLTLQDFSKNYDTKAVSKLATLFSKEGREIMRRQSTWEMMKVLSANPVAYSEKINSYESCSEINKFFDVLEESID